MHRTAPHLPTQPPLTFADVASRPRSISDRCRKHPSVCAPKLESMLSDLLDHELLLVRRGARSGAYTIIAVHSTALGPALGGCRLTTYAHPGEAVADALRLAEGMTLKAAVAGVELGGGKGVVCVEPGTPLTTETRQAMLLDFGDAVESLGGRYITAEDVGTSPADMRLIATRTEHLVGLPEDLGGLGDPSPFTALGVLAAMRACAEHRFGTAGLAGSQRRRRRRRVTSARRSPACWPRRART